MSFDVFSRFKIGVRIYTGFAVTLLLLAIIGTYSVIGLRTTESAMSFFSRVSDNTVKSLEIKGEVIALRRAALVYVYTTNAQALAQARALIESIDKHMAAVIDAATSTERRTTLTAIREAAARYGKDFENAAKMLTARDKAENERADQINSKIVANLDRIFQTAVAENDPDSGARSSQLQNLWMQIRLLGARFLHRPDPQLVDALKQRFAEMNTKLDSYIERQKNPDSKRLAQEAKTLAANYAQASDEITALTLDTSKLLDTTMSAYIGELTQKLNDIVTAAQTNLGDLRQSTQATVAQSITATIVIALVAFVFGMFVAWLIARSIVKPVSGLTAGMKELASGNFDVVLPGLGRKDEVGDMAQAVETFKVTAAEKAQREAEEHRAQEMREAGERRSADEREATRQREADAKAVAERKAAMHKLADDFEKAVGGIIDTVSTAAGQLETAANTLTKTAATTQHQSTVVASASEEASANVQAVASATEEMSGSVGEISRQVQESSNIARDAVTQASKTDTRITELSQAANRIGDVVKLITAIAEQTNLLALNATIEAARAGEAGRGFAVVASEVKALAGETAKATDEISTQITGMQAATQDSVAAIKEISATIGHISEIAGAIAAAVEEQGAATAEISRNVQEAAKGTAQVASNIVDVNRGASDTGSAASQVLSSAQALARESGHLKGEVAKFMQTVRAA
jgi:methyl-accepting chemotaxis protein